jgi:hypothetical protein
VTDRRSAAAVLAVVALSVGGCSSTGDAPGEPRATGSVPSFPPFPTESAGPGQAFEVPPLPPPVVWADDGRHLAVTTHGSSSCPRGPTDVSVAGTQELRVEIGFLFPGRDPCTADMAVTTTEVDVPDGISADEPLTVLLDHGEGDGERVILRPAGD